MVEYKIISEEHEWTSDFKLKFCGYGEWIEEPDRVTFEYLGYQGIVYRALLEEPCTKDEAWFGGYLCGYVKIPRDHPLFGQKDIDIECHGGVTFNEMQDVPEEQLIGFDCAHSGDYVPTMEHLRNILPELIEIKKKYMTEEMESHPLFNPVYRNVEYCINECKAIIDQLIELYEKGKNDK